MLAVFAMSGLMHELGLLAATRDLHGHADDGATRHTMTFFLACGGGIVAEGLWRQLTDRRVRGWAGRVWVFGFLLVRTGSCCFVTCLKRTSQYYGTPMANEWCAARPRSLPWPLTPRRVSRGLTLHLAPVRMWAWQRWVAPLSWVLPDDVWTTA